MEGWKNFEFGESIMILAERLLQFSGFLDSIHQFIHLYYLQKNSFAFDLALAFNAAQDYFSGCFEMHYWSCSRCFPEIRGSL